MLKLFSLGRIVVALAACCLFGGFSPRGYVPGSQVNFNVITNGGGEFAPINYFKTGQQVFYCDNTLPLDPTTITSDGYPISPAVHGGICTKFHFPDQATLPGNYAFIWTGTGSVTLGITVTTISGTSGSSPWVVTPGDPTATLTGNAGVTSTSAAPSDVKNLAYIYVGACTTLSLGNNCGDYDDYVAGKLFRAQFKNILTKSKVKTLRFLNWMGSEGSGANVTNMALWEHRKPLTFMTWGGEPRPSLYGGLTTTSGDDVSLTCRSGSECFGVGPSDKMLIIVQFDSTTTDANTTFNLNGTGAVPMIERQSGPICANRIGAINYDADLNEWIRIGADCNGQFGPGYIQNGVPVEAMVSLCNEVQADCWFTLPPYSLDPVSDFVTGLIQYTHDNLNTVAILEPANEQWNSGFIVFQYSVDKATVHWPGLCGNNICSKNNWYGKVVSTLGQAAAKIYGFGSSKYEVIDAIQTVSYNDVATKDRFNAPLYVAQAASPQTGYTQDAACKWATLATMANYWHPNIYGTAPETTLALQYALTSDQLTPVFNYLIQESGNDPNGTPAADQLSVVIGQFVTNAKTAYNCPMKAVTFYEGGYSPDYSLLQRTTPPVTSATNANPAVLTLGINSGQYDGVAGMTVHFTAAAGGTWSTIIGNQYLVSAADTNAHTITINLDSTGLGTLSSGTLAMDGIIGTITGITTANPCVVTVTNNPFAQFAKFPAAGAIGVSFAGITYTSGSGLNGLNASISNVAGNNITLTGPNGVANCSGSTYVSGGTVTASITSIVNGFRGAGKDHPLNSTYTRRTYMYAPVLGAVRPSMFQFGGGGNAWSALDPNVWNTTSQEYSGIALFNTGQFP